MAGHTGQSSQLFPVATGRNAQFLATITRNTLVRLVEFDLGSGTTFSAKANDLPFSHVAATENFGLFLHSLGLVTVRLCAVLFILDTNWTQFFGSASVPTKHCDIVQMLDWYQRSAYLMLLGFSTVRVNMAALGFFV
jgi:hypothetical protein